MGYDLIRFSVKVYDELVCTICSGVLEDPLQVPGCEHVFCRSCINEWIRKQPICPVDREPIKLEKLQPVPRILRTFLSKLSISCDHATYGCTAVVNLDDLLSHLSDCEYNPKQPMQCEVGCGLTFIKDELVQHNCLRELRALIATQQARLTEIQQELNDYRRELTLINGQCKDIVIKIGSTKILGIEISEHRAGYIFITGIKKGSIADKIPHIHVGDIILQIDGLSIFGKRHYDVAKYIKQKLNKANVLSMKLQKCIKTHSIVSGQMSC